MVILVLFNVLQLVWFLALSTFYAEQKKVAHTRLLSIGFRSWSRFLAVSHQVTWVMNLAVGCHYFLPGLQLPPQSLRGLLTVLLLGEQRQCAVGLLLWAQHVGDIDRLLHGRRHAAPGCSTVHGSRCGQCHVYSWRRKLYTDLLYIACNYEVLCVHCDDGIELKLWFVSVFRSVFREEMSSRDGLHKRKLTLMLHKQSLQPMLK